MILIDRLAVSLAASALILLGSPNVNAQTLAPITTMSIDAPSGSAVGRYTVVQANELGTQIPILIDSMTGQTWELITSEGKGQVWLPLTYITDLSIKNSVGVPAK